MTQAMASSQPAGLGSIRLSWMSKRSTTPAGASHSVQARFYRWQKNAAMRPSVADASRHLTDGGESVTQVGPGPILRSSRPFSAGVLAVALLLSVVLASCGDETDVAGPELDGDLASTRWDGVDSDGCGLHFLFSADEDVEIRYTGCAVYDPDRFPGTYAKDGRAVTITAGATTYTATVSGTTMAGTVEGVTSRDFEVELDDGDAGELPDYEAATADLRTYLRTNFSQLPWYEKASSPAVRGGRASIVLADRMDFSKACSALSGWAFANDNPWVIHTVVVFGGPRGSEVLISRSGASESC